MGKMRLIDAGPLEELFKKMANDRAGTWSGPAYITALQRVKAAPTVDAEPVVRCRDCTNRHCSEYCECRPDDFFCADGERGVNRGG